MTQKLGARKRKALGIPSYDGEDMLPDELITPAFYRILKSYGLPTARRSDGTYWDSESQEKWEAWRSVAS